jgi:thiol-disulfide isomerase/thioredoxin
MNARRLLLAALALSLATLVSAAPAPRLSLPELTPAQVEAFDEAETAAQEAIATKDWARAAKSLQAAARIHGGNEGLWYNLACVQALQGRSDAALQSLDLTALHGTPEFAAWLAKVESRTAPKPPVAAPADVATTAAEIEAGSVAAEAWLEGVGPVLGASERQAAVEAITSWKLASWDAVAAKAEGPARAEAEWSALQSLLRNNLQSRMPSHAAEVARRAAVFASSHPSSPHAGEALYAAAAARLAAGSSSASEESAREAALDQYERELLVLAASSTEGPGLHRALAELVALNEDDLDKARAFRARLGAVAGEKTAGEMILSQARGMHYRLEGLPQFEAKTLDGRTVSTESLRGKVTLIDFWATWCGPCRAELPHLKDAYAKYKDRGFEIVGVSLDIAKDGDASAFKAWCAENGVTWPQVFDGKHWEAGLAKQFSVKSIPFPLLVGRDGKVAFADSQLRGETLGSRIESLLEPPVGL